MVLLTFWLSMLQNLLSQKNNSKNNEKNINLKTKYEIFLFHITN